MEFKNRRINPQDSPRIPPIYSYLTDKTHRPYSMGSDIGQTGHQGFFPDHLLHLYSLRHSLPSSNPHDLHEAIQIEIEKQRIREEIIVSEVARRRVLEAEVRRELMMERESALQTNSADGFPFRSPSRMELVSPVGLPDMGARPDERSLEERITRLLNGKRESGRFETQPFQKGTPDLRASEIFNFLGKKDENVFGLKRKAETSPRSNTSNVSFETLPFIRNADMRVSEVKPFSQGGLEKQKVNFLGKPDEDVSKKAAVAPPRVDTNNISVEPLPFMRNADLRASEVKPISEGGHQKPKLIFLGKPDENISGSKRKASDFPPPSGGGGILHKKSKEEWICAICQVNSTSQQDLDNHLRGRKHKSRESGSIAAEKAAKNYNTERLSPEKGTTAGETGTVKTGSVESVSVEKVGIGYLNGGRYRFWCETCKVGTLCEKDMSDHKKGRKHANQLRIQNDGITENRDETGKSANHSDKISMLASDDGMNDKVVKSENHSDKISMLVIDDGKNVGEVNNAGEDVNDEFVKTENHVDKISMLLSDNGKKNVGAVNDADEAVHDEFVKTEENHKDEDDMMEEDDWTVYITDPESGVTDGILSDELSPVADLE